MNIEEWLGNSSKFQIDIWNDKYRYNNETFDQWLDRVSQNNSEYKKIIVKKQFLPGGRTLSNIGIPDNSSLMNCYSIGYVPDDYEKIMDTAKQIGITYKYQGGQGLSLTKIRPKDTPIGKRYFSDGIVPFMKIFNEVTEVTSQAGSRKGALLMSLDAWHKEALNFITIKSKDGLIEKANLSLEIDDEFMNAIDEFYETGEVKEYTRKETYGGHEVEWSVKPAEVFNAMVKNNWNWGDPGCIFTNRFRNYNIMQYDDEYEIQTANPCVTGDTTILTDAGYKRIDSLVGKKVNVWNGFEWSEVEPELTATDQEIYHIKFSDGCELNCTPYHKFILADGQRIEAKELKKGTKLARFLMPVINGTKELDHAYTQGFFSGDGYIRTETGSAYADLYHEKRNIQLDFLGARSSCDRIKRDTVRISVDFKDKKFVPDASYSVKSRLEWLAGMVDSDGCSTKDGSIQISSIDKEFLMNIKFMLNTLGINPVVSIMKHEENKLMPDQKGGKKEYHCKTSYRLSISGWYVGMLNSLGFKTQRVRHDVIPDRACKRFIYVTSIENTGKLSDVYCFTEYKNHSGIFNGVMTAQCGEQCLPKHGACCLGSINLSEFVKKQYTKNSFFDFNEFKKVVETVVRYMDDIVTINYSRHPLKEQQDMSYNYRNIGIGVMGYSNMLMKLGLEYGSREAIEFTDELFGIMFKTAVKASSKLAKERGSFPKYTPKVWKSDIIREHFSDGEIKTLKKDGLRNCSLLSVAPTGTLSNLLNVSGGCEPEFALKYTRRTVGMTGGKDEYYQVDCKSVQEYKDIYGSKVKLPKYFITANQINYNDRIATQSIMQKHVDTAISSTINLPESATEDDIAHIYLNSWKRGLKGVTIFRDNCSRIPILSTSKQKKDNSETNNKQNGYQRGEIIHNDNTIGLKRTLTSGCGRLHCQAFFDRNTGEFMELFLGKGSTGGCYSSLNGLARMVSLSARAGVKIGDIIEQLTSANACPSYGLRTAKEHDTSKGTCCPSAIGNALRDMQTEMSLMLSKFKNESETKENDTQQLDETDKCPVCGNKIVHVGGCISCNICGFNKCG